MDWKSYKRPFHSCLAMTWKVHFMNTVKRNLYGLQWSTTIAACHRIKSSSSVGLKICKYCTIKMCFKALVTSFRCGHAFSSYVYEPAIALPVFYDWLQKNGCTLVEKTIRKLDQLKGYSAVINCTGVGAKYLVEDHSIKPIRKEKN